MRGKPIDWSAEGKLRVWLWTLAGTATCVLITFAVDYPNLVTLEGASLTRTVLVDLFLPIALAGPAIFLLTNKIRQLAIAHRELALFASTDNLTGLLNRGAFTVLVEAYLAQTRLADDEIRGAFLVVDADNFKAVNDRHGHDQGDIALKIIARAIKNVLRGADIVGRIGGEEFGVFLPGAERIRTEGVAERIRQSVEEAAFAPDGTNRPLSVSVGGAVFRRRISYDDLFRAADRRLFAAKEAGRNRVLISAAVPLPAAA